MRPETVEKRLASITDVSRQGKRVNGLFRLLSAPSLWTRAYEQIASNEGALTPGIDRQNTLDGFSLERVEEIIARIMSGSYRFSPARRQYIPKPNGKKRPLGIPTADDKLVQAAVKILLEQIYEPIFSGQSHGFRRGRSCHTALTEIKQTWHGVKWIVEVDIVGYYDNIDHEILLNLLRRRIDDERLVALIGRMLKAGYLEDWKFYRTYSGAPQGGVISPILANIYLHELDRFMMEMKVHFDRGQRRRASTVAMKAAGKIRIARRKIDRQREKGKEDEVPALLGEIREWERRRRESPALDPFDPNYRRLRYCRYADDFVIGIIGGKEDARCILAEVSQWLTERLKLYVSTEKSGIVKASEGANFLGYKLKTFGNGRITRTTVSGKAVASRVASDQMQLHLPQEKLVRFAENRNLGNLFNGRATIRCELINKSDIDILIGYNALMRGFAEYYKLGKLWKKQLGRLYHLWWWSFMLTLAHKHKCSVRTVARRLRRGVRMGIWYQGRHKRTLMPLFRLKDVSPALAPAHVDLQTQASNLFRGRTDMIERLRERVCEACGTGNVPVEVHQVRRMTDMTGSVLATHVKAARTRKRVVLCRDCHIAHHTGLLQARLDR